MTRRPRPGLVAALLLTVSILLTGACSPDVSGDSNPGSQVDETPAPPAS